jgi:sterol desaturase/sphingolipid hydroxylase (fatty acid hydroxylase superfamily)
MAWWNGPVLVLIASLPAIPFSVFYAWYIAIITCIVVAIYYGIYEYIHWCMHLPRIPRQRLIERWWIFRKLNGHHLLHHRYMGNNFNVVLPLFDLLTGTLILRSKMRFAQARGPAVPDVQPIVTPTATSPRS